MVIPKWLGLERRRKNEEEQIMVELISTYKNPKKNNFLLQVLFKSNCNVKELFECRWILQNGEIGTGGSVINWDTTSSLTELKCYFQDLVRSKYSCKKLNIHLCSDIVCNVDTLKS